MLGEVLQAMERHGTPVRRKLSNYGRGQRPPVYVLQENTYLLDYYTDKGQWIESVYTTWVLDH
jgi:hypothetical protein